MALNFNAQATVNLNSQQFDQFVRNFNNFQRQLNTMPAQWRAVGSAATAASRQMQTAVNQMQRLTQTTTQHLARLNSSLVQTGRSFQTHLIAPMNRFMTMMGRGTGSAGGIIRGAGAGATGGIGGIPGAGGLIGGGRGGGGGGTFGRGMFYAGGGGIRGAIRFGGRGIMALAGAGSMYGINELAEGASNDRRFATGAGVSVGDARAYGPAFNRFFNGKEFLNSIASGSMIASPANSAIWSLGVDPLKGSTKEVANNVLMKIMEGVKGKSRGEIGQFFQTQNLQNLGFQPFDAFRMGEHPEEFMERYKKEIKMAEDMNNDDKVMKAWVDLYDQLKANTQVMKGALLDGLIGLVKPLEGLSGAVTNLMSTILRSKLMQDLVKSGGEDLDSLTRLTSKLTAGDWGGIIKDTGIWDLLMKPLTFGMVKPSSIMKSWQNSDLYKNLNTFGNNIGSFATDVYNGRGTTPPNPNATYPYQTPTAQTSWWESLRSSSPLANWVGNTLDAAKAGTGGFAMSDPNEQQQNIMKLLAELESNKAEGYATRGKEYPGIKMYEGSPDIAYGRYGVLRSNVREWTRKWYTKSLSPAEYLANPRAQDAVVTGEFGSRLDQFKNWTDALASWVGPGLAYDQRHRLTPAAQREIEAYVPRGLKFARDVLKIDVTSYTQTGSNLTTKVSASTGSGTAAGTYAINPGP